MSKSFVDTPLGSCILYARGNVPGGVRAAAFFGSFLPTLLAVVFLSTPRLRKQWAFWILAAALLIAMGKSFLEMQMMMRLDVYMFDLDRPESYAIWNRLYYADYFVQWTVPWICDCALLFKLLAFHPAPTTPWKRRAAIMAFPLAMHVPRMPLLAASLVLARANPEGIVVQARNQARLLVVEGALQVAQNCYCSGFLLYKARNFARADYIASNQQAHRARLGLRFFTESVLFTFLPASVLQLLWLAVAAVWLWAYEDDIRLIRADFYLRMFNVGFSINFGLLAVWWATARIHAQNAGQLESQLRTGTAKQLASALDMSLLDWALGAIAAEEDLATKDEAAPVASKGPAEERKCVAAEVEEDEQKEDANLRRRLQRSS